MFGSIGQPVSGVKSDRTARAFMQLQDDQAADLEASRRRGRARQQRLVRMVKNWFARSAD